MGKTRSKQDPSRKECVPRYLGEVACGYVQLRPKSTDSAWLVAKDSAVARHRPCLRGIAMVLETSRGIVQSLPGDGASWEGRALWFAGPRRRETTTMVRRSHRVCAGALGLRGRLALGAGSLRDGRSELWGLGAGGWCSRGWGAGVLQTRLPRGAERLGSSRILATLRGDQRAPSLRPQT